MKAVLASVAIMAGLVLGALTIGFDASGVATTKLAQPALPGMCNGRADANTQITAHANGRGTTKYILNIATDASATAEGVLVLGQGKSRLEVTEWCRVWQHLPGQPYPDQCEEGDTPEEGAITAHAVGLATLRTGERVLVRTDVRETEEGKFFRVRYRVLAEHGDDGCGDDGGCEGGEEPGGHEPGEDEGGCEDEGWVRVPVEGWAPLGQLRVRVY